MKRNWGLGGPRPRRNRAEGVWSFGLPGVVATAVFGAAAAAATAASFAAARGQIEGLFHGASMAWAIVAAGFGCWTYVAAARRRFAVAGTPGASAEPLSALLKSYLRAALALAVAFGLSRLAALGAADRVAALLLCLTGGMGAAAAFQAVLTFAPRARPRPA